MSQFSKYLVRTTNKSDISWVVQILLFQTSSKIIKQYSIYKTRYCNLINMIYNGQMVLKHNLIDR